MFRAKVTASFLLMSLLWTTPGLVHADVVHLSSGQSLTDVQVLSKNWKGYEVQITPNVTIFFSRDEVVGLDLDRIEPRRTARRKERTPTAPGTRPGKAIGDEVSPDMSARLQHLVNVDFENTDVRDIIKSLSDVYGVKVKLDPALFEPGGLADPIWSVNVENEQFIKVVSQLALDKGLEYSIKGDTIIVSKTSALAPGGESP